ncbi:MAG: response regulator [Streptosporangiales bacterium]|nr:response regulator [Streptosporangiales bacterium]
MHDVEAVVAGDDRRMNATRVLIVDDHALFGETLAARLAREPDLEVLHVASEARQAYAVLATGRPDVVVLDLVLGETSGLDVLDHIGRWHPQARSVILSAVTGIEPVVQVIRRGAAAWAPKTAGGDVLVRVIRGVARGEAWIPPDLLAELLRRLVAENNPAGPPDPLTGLTAREREVLQCMVDGLSRSETASCLGLSINTVRTHTRNLLAKLELHSGLEATAVALRVGMRPSRC